MADGSAAGADRASKPRTSFAKKARSSLVNGLASITGGGSVQKTLEQKMEDIFYVLDADGSGTISQNEIEDLAQGNEKVKAEIKSLLKQGDADGDNEYSKDEFMSIAVKWREKGLTNDYILKHM